MPPMSTQSKCLGEKIKRARWRAELTQREAAKRAGITAVYLCQLEHGQGLPSLELLARLADVLGTTAGRLLA